MRIAVMQPDILRGPEEPGSAGGWLMRQCGTVRLAATFGARHRAALVRWGPAAFLMEWARRRRAPGGPRDAMGCVVPQIARRIARQAFLGNVEYVNRWPQRVADVQMALLDGASLRALGRSQCDFTPTRRAYPWAGTVAIEQLLNLAMAYVNAPTRDYTVTFTGVTCRFHAEGADTARYALVDARELPSRFYLDTVGSPTCIACFERSSGYRLQKHVIDEPECPRLRVSDIKDNAERLDRTRINLTHVRATDDSVTVTGTKAYVLRASACRALRDEKRERREAAARESAAARRDKRARAARRKRARDRELECHRTARARRLQCMDQTDPRLLPPAFVRSLWNAEVYVGAPEDDPEDAIRQRVARVWGPVARQQ